MASQNVGRGKVPSLPAQVRPCEWPRIPPPGDSAAWKASWRATRLVELRWRDEDISVDATRVAGSFARQELRTSRRAGTLFDRAHPHGQGWEGESSRAKPEAQPAA